MPTKEITGWKVHKHMEASLKRFDDHRQPSQSKERHLRFSKCFSEAFECLCVPFIQRSLHFFCKSFLFLFLFFVLSPLRYFVFHVVSSDLVTHKIKNGVCLRPHGRSKEFIILNLFSICHWFDFLHPSSVTENN